jgi:5-methylcytosine-specific restriction enzyme subunit McrC
LGGAASALSRMTASLIPIRNLYYLLCYAWNKLDQGGIVDVERLESNDLADLFAHVLVRGVEHLFRRGVEQGYAELTDDVAGVRGRIQILPTARRFLVQHGKTACAFDELSIDTPANRILKATMQLLAQAPGLDRGLRDRLHVNAGVFAGVTPIRVRAKHFHLIQIHSNNQFYRFLLSVCELVHGAWLVNQQSGESRFRDFLRDEQRMAYVFQDFVLNFYRLERPDLRVRRENIRWKAASETDQTLSLLPGMETDISIRKGTERLIIDTKYYQETLSSRFGTPKVRSSNLYQLLGYLTNAEQAPGENLQGMLLYPTVNRHLLLKYTIQGFPVTIATVDLGQDWREIRRQLNSLVGMGR